MVDNESYSATLNLSEVPGDTTFTSELDAIGLIDSANVIKMHIKVQADFYHAVLESKAIQLAEVPLPFPLPLLLPSAACR